MTLFLLFILFDTLHYIFSLPCLYLPLLDLYSVKAATLFCSPLCIIISSTPNVVWHRLRAWYVLTQWMDGWTVLRGLWIPREWGTYMYPQHLACYLELHRYSTKVPTWNDRVVQAPSDQRFRGCWNITVHVISFQVVEQVHCPTKDKSQSKLKVITDITWVITVLWNCEIKLYLVLKTKV